MKMTARGRALLTQREGVRLKAYKDSVGILTIGVGHTSAAGPPEVHAGMTITKAECDAIFARDLVKYEDAVNKAVHVPITSNEFDALVSFCYNVGPGAMAGASVIRLLNARAARRDVADALLKWNKPPEIMGRRKSERSQFLTSYAAQDTKATAVAAGGSIAAGGTAAAGAKAAGFDTGFIVFAGILVFVAVISVFAYMRMRTP